jgi:hypothetical protein
VAATTSIEETIAWSAQDEEDWSTEAYDEWLADEARDDEHEPKPCP